MHIYMDVPQGNSLCSYLKQAKCHFFFLSFAKSENRRAEQVLRGRSWGGGMEEEVGEGCKRVNMMQILCTHGCKWTKKRFLVETFLNRGVGIKENGGGGKLKYNIL
jgi:hypothetical protein